MNYNNIMFTDTVDINAHLNGGAADAGVTYQVEHPYASLVSVDAATGVVTPIGFPDPDPATPGDSGICGVIISVINTANGYEVKKVVLAIRRNPEGNLQIGFVNIAATPATTLTLDYSTPGALFVSWSGADITTPIGGHAPQYLALWNETNNQLIAQLPLLVSGSKMVQTYNGPTNGSITISLKAGVTY